MILSGTGHRPNKLGGYGIAARLKVHDIAVKALEEMKPQAVISGMALGWDTALAEASFVLDIPLIAAVPFEGQESMWPHLSQQKYQSMLRRASEVKYICDPGYAPWKMQVRNEWMVDHSHGVIALWDGSEGGTGNCIRYAQKVGKPIYNQWDRYNEKEVEAKKAAQS